jgi:hypothetical protein
MDPGTEDADAGRIETRAAGAAGADAAPPGLPGLAPAPGSTPVTTAAATLPLAEGLRPVAPVPDSPALAAPRPAAPLRRPEIPAAGIKLPPPQPPEFALAWSYSRSGQLRECERAVFWATFGSRGLGLPTGDPDAGRAWALRHLTALPLAVGIAVHNAARQVLEAVRAGAEPPSYEAQLRSARGTLNHLWRASQPDLLGRFWSMPGVHAALREVVYRGELRAWEIEQARAVLAGCLRHLRSAPVLDDVRGCAASDVWLPEAGPVHFRLAPQSFGPGAGPRLAAWTRPLTVWAAPDLCYVHQLRAADAAAAGLPEGRRYWCVVDWKTGARGCEADERLQLSVYALWLEASGRPSTDDVYLGRIVALRDASERWYVLGPDERAAARHAIAADTERLLGLLAVPSHAFPRPKADWALAVRRGTCATCNYAALCHDDLATRDSAVGTSEDGARVPAASDAAVRATTSSPSPPPPHPPRA